MNHEHFDEFDDDEEFDDQHEDDDVHDEDNEDDEFPVTPHLGFIRQEWFPKMREPEPDNFPDFQMPEPRRRLDQIAINVMYELWATGRRDLALSLYEEMWREFSARNARDSRKKPSGTRRNKGRGRGGKTSRTRGKRLNAKSTR